MPHCTIDGIPLWYEEVGDPAGPPLVALHGGIMTFRGSFDDVLPWLATGRRVIGVELQGHGHTPDTGRPMSIDRFADDVAELIEQVVGAPVDVWGYSLGGLTAGLVRGKSRWARCRVSTTARRPRETTRASPDEHHRASSAGIARRAVASTTAH